ncbi:hypothetical protein A6V39_05205 [Candidatus Mycoplasma haematobovis]|uniref:Uncharacterized protein n=1 Tax=Candidatus Mycoplasma haematobovis TaxID=432608 RepID=A0A1A9QCY3_9MOLU|nr:hypothetical protein [Candidatus Mycoplasma haematobovis]OAL09826.1 hypothetical protein A6V39_05205 [Candidatus Mycoplasma haematobovis]
MHILAKAGLGIGAVAGISGASYGIYNSMQSILKSPEKTEAPSYAKELRGTLLSTKNNEDQEKWTSRLTSLKSAGEGTLIEGLSTIKAKNDVAIWTELRDWCRDNINNSSKGESDKEFKNIQSYCTFSIKEKIVHSISETEQDNSEKWQKAHEALKTISDESQLDDKLKEAKNKENEEAKKAIKDWCTQAYKKPYKGTEDKEFKNASVICLSKN